MLVRFNDSSSSKRAVCPNPLPRLLNQTMLLGIGREDQFLPLWNTSPCHPGNSVKEVGVMMSIIRVKERRLRDVEGCPLSHS